MHLEPGGIVFRFLVLLSASSVFSYGSGVSEGSYLFHVFLSIPIPACSFFLFSVLSYCKSPLTREIVLSVLFSFLLIPNLCAWVGYRLLVLFVHEYSILFIRVRQETS